MSYKIVFYSLNISIVEILLNELISTRSIVMNGVGIPHLRMSPFATNIFLINIVHLDMINLLHYSQIILLRCFSVNMDVIPFNLDFLRKSVQFVLPPSTIHVLI